MRANQSEAQYRRTPPSQIQRDRIQALNHRQQFVMERSNTNNVERNELEIHEHSINQQNHFITQLEQKGSSVTDHLCAEVKVTPDSPPPHDQHTVTDNISINRKTATVSPAALNPSN